MPRIKSTKKNVAKAFQVPILKFQHSVMVHLKHNFASDRNSIGKLFCVFTLLILALAFSIALKPMSALAKSNKDQHLPQWYSIQLDTYSTADRAKKSYTNFIHKFPEYSQGLRIEKILSQYPLRVGAYKDKHKAKAVLDAVRSFSKGGYIIHPNILEERLVYPTDIASIIGSESPKDPKNIQDKVLNSQPATLSSYLASEKTCYSIQLASPESKDEALNEFATFNDLFPKLSNTLRIEQISSRYAVRVGIYKTHAAAEQALTNFDIEEGPYVVKAKIIANRLVHPDKDENIADTIPKEQKDVQVVIEPIVIEQVVIEPVAAPVINRQEGPDTIEIVEPSQLATPLPYEQAVELASSEYETDTAIADLAPLQKNYDVVEFQEDPQVIKSSVVPSVIDSHDTDNIISRFKTNATALADEGVFSAMFANIALSFTAIACIFILLRSFFQKRPVNRAKTKGFFQTEKSALKLVPELEQLLQNNMNQSILAEENLVALNSDVKSIYITSASRRDGKTITALSLAYSLMKGSANTVLLIDGSVGNPELHSLLGTPMGPGLFNVLNGGIEIQDTIIETAYPRLSFIPYGTSNGNSGKLDNPEVLKNILSELQNSYKYIIFDGSSMWGTPHTALISACFDGVLIAVEAEHTKWELVQNSIEKIQRIKGNVLGVVLNKRNFYIPRFLYGKI
ncbi:SPOR domain-containing protein [Maridesulfovibrio frigidus]|uniref:SPOR domain-containing protein n=1 Tax=Maridesulfovibrio frigidus TaxID=340956 RepID=UPI0004E1D44E|nr:SPOR domain-containing protein [Maridesulfovibrio frigidus]